jgi:hemerythrin
MLLLWTENLRVGVDELDRDNKRLVAQANALHGAIQAGESKKLLKGVLDELEDYAWRHCSSEEAAFQESGYPDAAAHTAEHEELREMVGSMKQQRDRGLDFHLSIDVMNLIYFWITNHIYRADRKYAEYIRMRGILHAPLGRPANAHAPRYSTPAEFLASGAPGANQETIAHSERMAPMRASESAIGTSNQRAASILSPTKASSAPNP